MRPGVSFFGRPRFLIQDQTRRVYPPRLRAVRNPLPVLLYNLALYRLGRVFKRSEIHDIFIAELFEGSLRYLRSPAASTIDVNTAGLVFGNGPYLLPDQFVMIK